MLSDRERLLLAKAETLKDIHLKLQGDMEELKNLLEEDVAKNEMEERIINGIES